MLSISVICNSNNMKIGPRFCDKSIQCSRILWYEQKLNLLLGLSSKIVTMGWVFAITISFVVIKLSNCNG